MQLTLYHYVHCPFCVRVRMGLGYMGLKYHSQVLPYDDEITPVKLAGKKMLPIMVIDGRPMNESLEIIEKLDEKKLLKVKEFSDGPRSQSLNQLLDKLGKNVHNLAMPYWIYTQEFNESSRHYFQSKKELKRGPFKALVKKRPIFEEELMRDLVDLAKNLRPFYESEEFGIWDIMLASHLWGLYIVPEFQFPPDLHTYLQKVKAICHFNYHEDFWR
jgi:glutaredoxin 2